MSRRFANRSTPAAPHPIDVIVKGQFWTQGSPFDRLFEAVAEATEGRH
jgi:hypothetical protein